MTHAGRQDPVERWNRSRIVLVTVAVLVAATVCSVLAPVLRAETLQYRYDSMQRLTRVSDGAGTAVDYIYDNLGNRLMKTTTLPTAPPNSAPSAVNNPGISNAAINVSATPLLNWGAAIDPDPADSVTYYVYFGTNPNPPLAYSGWQTNWAPDPLQCFTTYYWYVAARDSHDAQTSGPVWSFTTGDVPPIPDFSGQSTSGLAPLQVSFQEQSQHPCGAIASWQWSFQNNGLADSTNQNPSFIYTAAGDYTVKLTIQDEHGGVATIVKTNFVSVLGPNIVNLVPRNLQIESAGPYGNLVVSYLVTNTGTISLSGKWQWSDWFYLSTNQVLDSAATQVASFDESQVLPAGAFYRRTNMVSVLGYALAGQYLYLNADGADQLAEFNTNNNVLAVRADTRLPDLMPGRLSVSGLAIAGQPITLTYSVTNSGNLDIKGMGGADVDLIDAIYLSTNSTWDATATPIGSMDYSGILPAGAAYTQTGSAYLPLWPLGNYWLFLNVNDGGLVAESDVSNNLSAVPISLGAPNLVPLSIHAPQSGPSDARIQIIYAVTNQGNAAALGTWADTLYLSTNSVWDTNAYSLVDSYIDGPVPAQSSYAATNSVRLPGWPAGTYYLILIVDSYGNLSQGANTVLAIPIALQTPAGLPDLVPLSLVAPVAVLPGATIQVVYSVTNSGPTPVVGDWFDELWFSTNAVWDSSANQVGSQSVAGPVPNGGSYVQTNTVIVPTVAAGKYYLILRVDALGMTDEASRTNKDHATAILMEPASLLPELAAVSLLAPSSATPGQSIQMAYAVTNRGGSAAAGPWFDSLSLSTNATADGAVDSLGFWTIAGPVAAGSGYASTNDVILPNATNGLYYLILTVDSDISVNQSTRANGALAVPIVLGTSVVPTATPIVLEQASMLAGGAVQFTFTNTTGVSFRVFATTDLSVPFSDWTLLGNVTETSPGLFQFTDLQPGGGLTHFYRVRTP